MLNMSILYTVWNSAKKAPSEIMQRAEFYKSRAKGAALDIISSICKKDPQAHIEVYGGDGSVYEACNAVMSSGKSDSVLLTIVPSGTGNDFIKNFNKKAPSKRKIDLIRFNDKYSANVLNLGFDCDVVIATDKIKKIPIFKGSISYIIGVITTFLKPMGKDFEFEYITEDDKRCTCKGNLLLCLIGNGKYYGGGFKCAPLAKLDDGLLELIYVKNVDRLTFIKFIPGFKSGKHVTKDGKVNPKYENWLTYKRIKSITFKNAGLVCADGEIMTEGDMEVTVVPSAVNLYN